MREWIPLRRPKARHQSIASKAQIVMPAQRAFNIKPAVRKVRKARMDALKDLGTKKAAAKKRFAA